MVIVPARRGRRTDPAVTFRASGRQRCIAFNASLSLQVDLAGFTHVAINWDDKARRMTFIPTSDEEYQGAATHRLQNDGGGNTKSRVTYLHVDAIPESAVPNKSYTASLGRKNFTISY